MEDDGCFPSPSARRSQICYSDIGTQRFISTRAILMKRNVLSLFSRIRFFNVRGRLLLLPPIADASTTFAPIHSFCEKRSALINLHSRHLLSQIVSIFFHLLYADVKFTNRNIAREKFVVNLTNRTENFANRCLYLFGLTPATYGRQLSINQLKKSWSDNFR